MGMKISISTLKDSVSLSGTSEAVNAHNGTDPLEYVSQETSAMYTLLLLLSHSVVSDSL